MILATVSILLIAAFVLRILSRPKYETLHGITRHGSERFPNEPVTDDLAANTAGTVSTLCFIGAALIVGAWVLL